MSFLHFIGIDVSKEWFDSCQHGTAAKPQRFPNSRQGLAAFMTAYAEVLPQALVVLESTGGYENLLVAQLLAEQVAVHRADPLAAKHFIRSLRLRGKTDALDAQGLARYAAERGDRLPRLSPTTPFQQRLSDLVARRDDLVAMRTQEKQRLQHPRYANLHTHVLPILTALEEQIQAVDRDIADTLNTCPTAQKKLAVLTQVPGVGQQTAATLLATLPELGALSRRQVASLAGLAPHPRDSGQSTPYRAVSGGRHRVRRALFMAAMSARNHAPDLKAFYERLIQNGKKPLLALTALMRKLITILNAKIRDLVLLEDHGR